MHAPMLSAPESGIEKDIACALLAGAPSVAEGPSMEAALLI